jgi:uncharacterized protein with ParB-like and HNH nuclease domain
VTTLQKLNVLQTQLEKERKLVSFDSYDLSVRQLLDMIEAGEIFVPPEYQRQFIWDPERQSVLIESVFLGIPVPSLFMATNSDATWEVVDGVQRLGTLSHFVASGSLLKKISRDAPLEIAGLEKLSALNGFSFESLPKSLQLHFLTRPMRVTVLNDKSDLSVRFDLFERLNTGGVTLTFQEIRNCVYRGALNEDIKELSTYPAFRSSVKVKDSHSKNGTYEEMVLRFFAYLDGYAGFDHSVKEFLNDYMKNNQKSNIDKKKADLFRLVFDKINGALPDGIARTRSTTPANLYEALAVGTALAIQKGAKIDAARFKPLLTDEKLKAFTGAGSNQRKFVIGRIEYVRDKLL